MRIQGIVLSSMLLLVPFLCQGCGPGVLGAGPPADDPTIAKMTGFQKVKTPSKNYLPGAVVRIRNDGDFFVTCWSDEFLGPIMPKQSPTPSVQIVTEYKKVVAAAHDSVVGDVQNQTHVSFSSTFAMTNAQIFEISDTQVIDAWNKYTIGACKERMNKVLTPTNNMLPDDDMNKQFLRMLMGVISADIHYQLSFAMGVSSDDKARVLGLFSDAIGASVESSVDYTLRGADVHWGVKASGLTVGN